MSNWPGQASPRAPNFSRPNSVASTSSSSIPKTPGRTLGDPVTPRKVVPGPVTHTIVTCDLCQRVLEGLRHKCLNCPDFDLCQDCVDYENGKSTHSAQFMAAHIFIAIPLPRGITTTSPQTPSTNPIPRTEPIATNAPAHAAFCDVCRAQIIGSRHRCLDCQDYDMCSVCIVAARKQHPFSHQFSEIKEPGQLPAIITTNRPIGQAPGVTTPSRGRGEVPSIRPSPSPSSSEHLRQPSTKARSPHSYTPSPCIDAPQQRQNDPKPTLAEKPSPPARHEAGCDLCQATIVGVRHKCLTCPDFDTCEKCFSLVPTEHPKHKFVKFADPGAVVDPAPTDDAIAHHAHCNECGTQITGARFKCLHPSCPNYDLCENCEARPIPVHPTSHPLLKLKEDIASYATLKGVFDLVQQGIPAPIPVQELPVPPIAVQIAPPSYDDASSSASTSSSVPLGSSEKQARGSPANSRSAPGGPGSDRSSPESNLPRPRFRLRNP